MNVGFKTPIRLDAEPAERSIDLRTYLNFLWRHWMFIGAVVALALLVGFIYLARATPMYTATAEILLDPQRQRVAGADTALTDLQYDYTSMESQLTIIKSDPLLQRVVIKERLALPPPATEKEPQGASDADAKSAEAQRIQAAVNRLRGALKVSRVGQFHCFRYFGHVGRSGASCATRQCYS